MNPWYYITLMGTPGLWAAVCGFLIVFYLAARFSVWKGEAGKRRKFKGIIVLFVLSLFITFGIIYSLKAVLNVPRTCVPCPAPGCNPYCPPDSGFPSGHTATMFVLFTFVLVTKHRRFALLLLLLAVLVAVSRVALDVHTWVDVIGGAALGILVVIGVWRLEKRLKFGQIMPK